MLIATGSLRFCHFIAFSLTFVLEVRSFVSRNEWKNEGNADVICSSFDTIFFFFFHSRRLSMLRSTSVLFCHTLPSTSSPSEASKHMENNRKASSLGWGILRWALIPSSSFTGSAKIRLWHTIWPINETKLWIWPSKLRKIWLLIIDSFSV